MGPFEGCAVELAMQLLAVIDRLTDVGIAPAIARWDLLGLPQVQRCCIDQTGIGRQFAERAQARFGRYAVEGVQFTGPAKEELAYPLRAACEDRAMRIPGTAAIRADLRGVKKETTAAGNIRFAADRGKNGHSDRFWALALALHAGKPAGVAYGAVLV